MVRHMNTPLPPKARRGRPHVKDPAKTYEGLSYVVTTFRLKKRTVAEADTIAEALALGTRTNAVQYAIAVLFGGLHRSAGCSMTRAELDRAMRRRLKKLGG